MGARITGGLGMALPGIAAGGTMAAGLLGYRNPLGLLDPFTGISRAFGAGTGVSSATGIGRMGVMAGESGMGLMHGFGNVGRAFASGGLRAGAGVLAGGLAGAAAAAIPYYIAGKAIETVGTNIFQGAQNVKDVGRMATQYFEPQWGQGGAGMGGGPGRGMIKNVTSFLHEMAGEDVMTSMQDMRRLMDRAGQSGMLEGVGDVNQFKRRFRDIVGKTKAVAQILGTTLDEAMPLVQNLNKMGLWSAADVMGTAVAGKAAGPGGGAALMGAMQTGAQMSHAMGGTLRAGARLGRELFTQVSGAVHTGVLSREDIRNFTGGVTGAEGRQMVAGSLQQVMSGMGQTAMGRLMMAGLGEIEGGQFTGRMDPELLAKFQRGEVTIGQLQAQGRKRVSNKSLAVSFFNRADQMGQSMAAQGGVEAMSMGIQQAMNRAGYGAASEPIQNRFIQLLTGANQRQADVIQKMIQEMPRITADNERRMEAALEDSFRNIEQRRNQSWAGFKDAVGSVWEEAVERPLQELGENLATEIGSTMDKVGRWMTGRTRRLPKLSMRQQMHMAAAGAMDREITPQMLGAANVGQGFVDPGILGNMTMQMREQGAGFLGRVAGYGAMGAAAGSMIGPWGTALGGLAGATMGAVGIDPLAWMGGGAMGMSGYELSMMTPRARSLVEAGLETQAGPAGASEVNLGGGRSAKSEDVRRISRRTMMRSMDATMGGLLGGETQKKRQAMDTVKRRVREMFNSKDSRDRLQNAKDASPREYGREVLRMLEGDSEARAAMRELTKGTPGGEGTMEGKLDVLAVAQGELKYKQSDLAVDYDRMAREVGVMTEGDLDKIHEENLGKLADISEGMVSTAGGAIGGAVAGAAMGAVIGSVVPVLGTVAGGIVGGILGGLGLGVAGGMAAGEQISEDEWAGILSSEEFSPQDISDYISGKAAEGNRFTEAANRGDTNAKRVMELLQGSSQDTKDALAKELGTSSAVQQAQMWKEKKTRMRDVAKSQGPITGIQGIKDEGLRSTLERARQAFAKEDLTGGRQLLGEVAKSGDLSQKEIDLLLQGRAGEVGRQAGRLGLIEQMGEMDEAGVRKFRQRMRAGGVDLFTGVDQERLNELLKGGIKGRDVGELKDMLRGVSGAALGEGPGARKSQNQSLTDMLTKYAAANERFVFAVGSVLGDKIKDEAMKVKQSNPVAQET